MVSEDANQRRCIYLEDDKVGDTTNVKVTGSFSIDPTESSFRDCADDKNKVKILPGKLVNLSTN